MTHTSRLDGSEGQLKGRCFTFVPLLGLAFLAVLLFSLSFTFADSDAAVRQGGYWEFAKASNTERVFNKRDCLKYGGRPAGQGENELVLGRGRTDTNLYNVLWFGGRQYVTYKIDTSSTVTRLFGYHTHAIWLCQF